MGLAGNNMPLYTFECSSCGSRFEEIIYLNGGEPPDYHDCDSCSSKAQRVYWVADRMPTVGKVGTSKRELEVFRRDGMPKEMAEEFYKLSIQASKERMAENGHYKEVVPNVKQQLKDGLVRANDDKKKAETIEKYKKIGATHIEKKNKKKK
jgi:putative FmdB family regulatory protein